MAFSVDQASLGTAEGSTNATTATLTTTNAVASNGLIVVGLGFFNTNGMTGITFSGGGLTWTTAVSVGLGANSDGGAIGWALAPSGLASATVITATPLGTGPQFNSPILGAMSFLGADASPQDGTSSRSSTAGNPWSGNAVSTTGSSDLVIGVGWGDGNTAVTTDTPTSPWSAGPLLSDSGTNGGVCALVYRMNVASGSYTPGGTWAGSVPTATVTLGAGFLASGTQPAGPAPVNQVRLSDMRAKAR